MTEHASVGECKRMVEPEHSGLNVLQQCILLGLSRASFYYKPVCESEFNLMIIDITYIPMRHGFMYLAAIIDVFSRRVMGWG